MAFGCDPYSHAFRAVQLFSAAIFRMPFAAVPRFSSGGTGRTAGRLWPACCARGIRRRIATSAGRWLLESCQRPKPRPGEGRRLGWRYWGGRSFPEAKPAVRKAHFNSGVKFYYRAAFAVKSDNVAVKLAALVIASDGLADLDVVFIVAHDPYSHAFGSVQLISAAFSDCNPMRQDPPAGIANKIKKVQKSEKKDLTGGGSLE